MEYTYLFISLASGFFGKLQRINLPELPSICRHPNSDSLSVSSKDFSGRTRLEKQSQKILLMLLHRITYPVQYQEIVV